MLEGDQFNAVSEYVLNVTAFDSWYLVVFADWNAGGSEFHDHAAIVGAGERRMRLLGRAEIFFNSEMNVDVAAFQPKSTTRSEFRRLENFFHSEQRAIELTSIVFMPLGHGELHVIQLYERN